MVNFTAYWNSASARLILIGVTLQISLVAIFSFMEAFSDADIASKTFGLYTEPRMIKKKPKKGEKKAKKDKKEKKDKKDKKDKESPKKKGKKGDGDQQPEKNDRALEQDNDADKKQKQEESQPPEVSQAVEKSAKPLFENSVNVQFDSLRAEELLKVGNTHFLCLMIPANQTQEEAKKMQYQFKAKFYIDFLLHSHILITCIRLITPGHNIRGIILTYLHSIIFIVYMMLIWMEAWVLAKLCIYSCTILNLLNLCESVYVKSFQINKLDWIADELEN